MPFAPACVCATATGTTPAARTPPHAVRTAVCRPPAGHPHSAMARSGRRNDLLPLFTYIGSGLPRATSNTVRTRSARSVALWLQARPCHQLALALLQRHRRRLRLRRRLHLGPRHSARVGVRPRLRQQPQRRGECRPAGGPRSTSPRSPSPPPWSRTSRSCNRSVGILNRVN
jgi:hypothetical protein